MSKEHVTPAAPTLDSAWLVVERSGMLARARSITPLDARVVFHMGVQATLSALLSAIPVQDQPTADALACLQTEVKDFFDLFGLSTAVPN
jgi:hypothetical protein